MSPAVLDALLFGVALSSIGAFMGTLVGSSISAASRFHPGRLRRWLRRLAFGLLLVAVGCAIAGAVAFGLPSSAGAIVRTAVWLAGFTAFGLGYRFASGQRMLRALDSGIAVGLH